METDISLGYPPIVYKFYSLEEYHQKTLIGNYLFPCHPYHLNDLMDGEVYAIDMRGVSSNIYTKIKQQILEHSPSLYEKEFVLQLFPEIDTDRRQLQSAIMASYFSFGGIISLTSYNRFSGLMWAHYAQESGFMIEFDTKRLLESIGLNDQNGIYKKLYFRKIEYRNHPMSISCSQNPDIEKINLFNTTQKSQEWSYEKEWRIIVTSDQKFGLPESVYAEDKQTTDISKRKLYYDRSAIKRIYLGRKFWASCIEKKEIMPNNENNVRIYHVKSEHLPFIEELSNYHDKVYVSGVCDCSEYRHGTDVCVCNVETRKCEFNPDYYYQTRSFGLIKRMEIVGKDVYVIYDDINRTKDEEFD